MYFQPSGRTNIIYLLSFQSSLSSLRLAACCSFNRYCLIKKRNKQKQHTQKTPKTNKKEEKNPTPPPPKKNHTKNPTPKPAKTPTKAQEGMYLLHVFPEILSQAILSLHPVEINHNSLRVLAILVPIY